MYSSLYLRLGFFLHIPHDVSAITAHVSRTSTLTLLGFRTLSDRVTRSPMVGEKTTGILSHRATREDWKIDKSKTRPKMYHNLDTKSPQTRLPTDQESVSKQKQNYPHAHPAKPHQSPLPSHPPSKTQYFPPTPFAITSYASPPHTSPSPPSTPSQAAASPSHTRAQSTKRPWHPCMGTLLAYLPRRTQGRRCVPAVGERRARRRL